jgi:hypothetical protein
MIQAEDARAARVGIADTPASIDSREVAATEAQRACVTGAVAASDTIVETDFDSR